MSSLDLTKPLFTKNGCAVTLLSDTARKYTDKGEHTPLVGIHINDAYSTTLHAWTKDGESRGKWGSEADLTNTEPVFMVQLDETYGESPIKTFDRAIEDASFNVTAECYPNSYIKYEQIAQIRSRDELYKQAKAEDRAITFWLCVALVVIFFAIYGFINFIDYIAG